MSAVNRPQGAFTVDAAGQATYRIPIEVPPGIGGCQPHLELVYSHRQPNGPLGVGWGLSGTSAITRVKATYAVDGFNGAVAYDDNNDRYALDGQRLINVQGDYGQPGTLYYTEVQSWRHVLAGASPTDGFTVVMKTGEVWEYGTTPDSLILAEGGSKVRVWALSAQTDRNGNRIEYSYTQYPDSPGAYYLQQISYNTNSGVAANRFVQFTYEQRPDAIADSVGGFPVVMAYRLTQISTAIAVNGANTGVRSYTFNYRTSTATQLSCVETITEVAADGSSLPPTQLVWQDTANPGFSISPSSSLDQHFNQLGIRMMNVSGSGRTDLVQLWQDTDSSIHATTYLATPGPDGESVSYVRTADNNLGTFTITDQQIFAADVDGDSRTDLIFAYENGADSTLHIAVFLSNGTGFVDGGDFATGDPWQGSQSIQFFAMDANGDGRTDLVQAYVYTDPNLGDLLYFNSYLSQFGDGTGAMFTAITSPTEDQANLPNMLSLWPMDVNGDGMMDMVRVWQDGSDSHVHATAYLGVCTAIDQVSFTDSVDSDLGAFNLADQLAFLPMDVTGNGIADLLQVWQEQDPTSGNTTLHLTTFLCNAAGGFTPGPDSPFLNQPFEPNGFYPMGFNGGGLAAILNQWITGDDELMFTVFSASPSGVFSVGPSFDAGVAGSALTGASFYPGDANGDGKADLLRVSFDQNQQLQIVPYLSVGPYPDFVTTITDALGGMTTIEYAPLSDTSVYVAPSAASFPKTDGLRYPNPLTPTQFPVQGVLGQAIYVVSSYARSNDPSLNRFSYAVSYAMTYSGARLDLLGRGWEGFQTVNKLDQESGRYTTQTYNQEFPLTGTLAETRIEAQGVSGGQPTGLLSVASSTYAQFVRATGASAPNPQVIEVLQIASRTERYEYGAFDYALGQSYAYDDYGNQIQHVNLGYVDSSGNPIDSAEVVYRYNLYQNDVSSNGWALGFLLYAKVSANASDSDITQFLPGDYQLEQRTYATLTYNLETQGEWDNSMHGVYLTTSYAYDSFGNRTAETKPGGFVTSYDYDPDYNTFRMKSTSPPTQQGETLVVFYGYDPRYGVEVARCDANGAIWITGLDAFGRKALSQGPVPNLAGAASDSNAVTPLVTGISDLSQAFQAATVVTVEMTSYLDDGQGGLYSEVQALQEFPLDTTRVFLSKQSYVDGRARVRETVLQSGQSAGDIVTLTDYDSDGKPVLQSLPFFSPSAVVSQAPHAVLTTYDVLERPLTQQTPSGADGSEFSITTWAYALGRQVTTISADGSQTPYTQLFEHHFYDGKDKVQGATVDPAGANATTVFEYDPLARLIQATDPVTPSNPQGVSNLITYDSLNRRLTFDNPDQNTTGNSNIKAMTYEYDPVTGRLQQQTDAAGQVTVFTYDDLGRVIQKTLGDGRTILYAYDEPSLNGQGRLTQATVQAGDGTQESQYAFAYDMYGNTNATALTIAGESFVTGAVFDPQQRAVQQTFPDSSVQTRLYAFGNLVSQSLDGAQADYPLENYSPSGKAGQLIYGQGILPGGGVVTNYTFSPSDQVYGEVVTGSVGQVLNLTYQYDLLGQMLAITDQDNPGQSQAFTYLNKRLSNATVPGFAPAAYEYDASGNTLGKEGVSYTFKGHFPTSGMANGQQVYAATPDACGRTQQRTSNGNAQTFAYDGLGCLSLVSDANGQMVSEMLSNYLGRLLLQTDAQGNQVLYINAAYQVTQPAQGVPSVTKYLRDDRGTAAAITTGAETNILYFRRDHKDSTTHTFDANGNVASQIAYSGYGQALLLSGSDDFGPKYEQRQWNVDFGLYYFGARYYDPVTGRFLTPDNEVGGENYLQPDVLNRYAFELNNPINHTDPTGHMATWVQGLLIGLAAVAVGVLVAATGGAALGLSPLAVAVISGALLGGGLSATAYSATHNKESDFSWKDFGIQAGISAGVGALSGGAFYGLSSAGFTAAAPSLFATTGRTFATTVIGSGLISGTADVGGQFFTNLAEGQNLSQGLGAAAVFGVGFGLAGGMIGFGFGKLAPRVAASYSEWRYGAQFEEQAQQLNRTQWGGWNAQAQEDRALSINTFRDYQSFPRPVDEVTPVLHQENVTRIMNSSVARLAQVSISSLTSVPEAYLENADVLF